MGSVEWLVDERCGCLTAEGVTKGSNDERPRPRSDSLFSDSSRFLDLDHGTSSGAQLTDRGSVSPSGPHFRQIRTVSYAGIVTKQSRIERSAITPQTNCPWAHVRASAYEP